MGRRWAWLAVGVGVAVAACDGPAVPERTAAVVTTTTTVALDPADEALLARLVIAPESDGAPYDRESFDYPKGGTDSRGCTTRALVLIRDSTVPAQVDHPGCKVLAGRWVDAYSGAAHEAASELSVDHVVALREAWRSGAAAWEPPRRVAFGNDLEPGALVLVTGSGNSAKGDKDPAGWAPADAARARAYAVDVVGTKVRWGLTADPAEVAAIRRLLAAAPAPAVAQGVRAPTTVPPVSFPTCAAARAAGAAPVRRGDPGYSRGLDRDGDGVACEG